MGLLQIVLTYYIIEIFGSHIFPTCHAIKKCQYALYDHSQLLCGLTKLFVYCVQDETRRESTRFLVLAMWIANIQTSSRNLSHPDYMSGCQVLKEYNTKKYDPIQWTFTFCDGELKLFLIVEIWDYENIYR